MSTEGLFINSVYIKNFRRFKEVSIKFNKGFNILVGPNGSGKTSILRALSMSLSVNAVEDSRVGTNSEIWTEINNNTRKYRVGLGPNWGETFSYRDTQLRSWAPPITVDGTQSVGINQIQEFIPNYCPHFIGAYRKFNYTKINGMTREEPVPQQRNLYRHNAVENLNGISLPNVKQWLINRYFLIEKEWAKNEKINWEWLMETIDIIGPKDSGFTFVGIERDLEPKFLLYGQETYLEELSAGFQSVLSMILSIFEWIEATNEDANMIVKNAKGTVIIDELDVHLHPEWQLTISESLKTIFPNLQFIVTTHSPHIIAAAEEGEVITIPRDDNFNIVPLNNSYSGWSTEQILEDIMGVNNLDNKYYDSLIDEATSYLFKKDKEGFKKVLQEIERLSHPNDTITSALKIQLAKLDLSVEED